MHQVDLLSSQQLQTTQSRTVQVISLYFPTSFLRRQILEANDHSKTKLRQAKLTICSKYKNYEFGSDAEKVSFL